MKGSQQFHDKFISHLTQNQQTLEQILQDEIISIESNKILLYENIVFASA